MDRLQTGPLVDDLQEKLVFLTGPRQVGKTTLARSLIKKWPNLQYLNYDADNDRRIILRQGWDRSTDLLVLDEVHKLKGWKTRLKGVYDTEGIPPRILVTGSARLDIYRRGGDSLAGRYHRHRLYPLSVRELRGVMEPDVALEQLLRFSGFPEPFLAQSEKRARRWRKMHLERIVRGDVMDLEPVRDIQSMLLLVDLLRERVGSPVSYANLARDLEISPHTCKRWVQTLANMYVVFLVTPYHRKLGRALLKEPKVYFYDVGAVIGDEGARLENLVAVSLLKHLHYLEDNAGNDVQLHYVRDKEKREVDFVTVIDRQVDQLIEVKVSNGDLHRPLAYFRNRLRPREAVQVVRHLDRHATVHGVQIRRAATWLTGLAL